MRPAFLTQTISRLLPVGLVSCFSACIQPVQPQLEQGHHAAPSPVQPVVLALGPGVPMTFLQIPAGKFIMGSPESAKEHADDEGPQTKVVITQPILIGETEVTLRQWSAFVDATGYRTQAEESGDSKNWRQPGFDQTPDHPVTYVSWDDAAAFCNWLSKNCGRNSAIPSESQWEYACRAGATTRFSWGDDENGLDEHSWSSGNSGLATHPVGQKKPNAWGLYDMHGNVSELTSSWYGSYPGGSDDNWSGPEWGSLRVSRGGSWDDVPMGLGSASRIAGLQNGRGRFLGFRVCLLEDAPSIPVSDANLRSPSPEDPALLRDRLAREARENSNAYYKSGMENLREGQKIEALKALYLARKADGFARKAIQAHADLAEKLLVEAYKMSSTQPSLDEKKKMYLVVAENTAPFDPAHMKAVAQLNLLP